MSSDILISAKHISKCYEIYPNAPSRFFQLFTFEKKFYTNFWALHDLSLTIKRGESVGIIGRNGSGKSTLLQVLAGILTPTTGSVKTCGRISAMLELGSGFHPDYTGRENIALAASLQGIDSAFLKKHEDEIIDFAAIGDFIDQPLKTYSSGMMVRLAFSVMTLLTPDILIIDEALAVGDQFFQAKCYSHLHKLIDNGVALLFVSHAQPVVTALCGRCIVLEKGRMIADTDPATAFDIYMKRNAAAAVDTNKPKQIAVSDETRYESELQPPFLSRVQNRITSDAACFTDCMLLVNGKEVLQPEVDQSCTIRTVLQVNTTLNNYEIGCVISTIEGVGLFALNSFFNHSKTQVLTPGKWIVDFQFHNKLLPGAGYFKVDLGLRKTVQGDYADKVFNALVFDVAHSREINSPLLLHVSGDIAFKQISKE